MSEGLNKVLSVRTPRPRYLIRKPGHVGRLAYGPGSLTSLGFVSCYWNILRLLAPVKTRP